MDLVAAILKGDIRAAARLLTLIENRSPEASTALARLTSHGRPARHIGITGPPGAGKSTLIDRLAIEFRRRLFRVGVLAVDPTSPRSGGAILGDRVRMRTHLTDDGVFIRSLATRGAAGGLPVTTIRSALKLLDAMGMEVALVETIGAGQDQVGVRSVVHTVVFVLTPGMGDEVQALKSGVLEVADLCVLNKADLGGGERIAGELEEIRRDGRQMPVIKVSALQGTGVGGLAEILLLNAKCRVQI
jgi:LAO/AO transport system kinase